MPQPPLWAKSKSIYVPIDPPTVASHGQDVHRAAVAVWDAIEGDLASILQTGTDLLRRELRPLYFIAALLHDIGKANSSFQKRVHGDRTKRQPVRHEILSALLIAGEPFFGPWLRGALADQERWAVAWAVGGHHLQMQAQTELDRANPLLRLAGSDKTLTIYLRHPEIASLLLSVKEVLASQGRLVGTLPALRDQEFTTEEDCSNSIEPLLHTLVKDSRRLWAVWKTDRPFVRQLAILKSLLIATDVAGSALVANGQPVTEWIVNALGVRLRATDLTLVVENRLQGSKPRTFQARVGATTSPVTVVAAGCGNGKTVAAYLWAKRWAMGKKLFFAYPSTGTTSAGFEDYLLAQTHLERALIHSRAQVDLQAMVGSPEDDLFEAASRLEALKTWGQQVIACTVDTVLGLMQNQRRGLFSAPAIACSAFVFDEIHNYDQRLFGELLTFLRMFPGAPVLLMSASLPPTRLSALRQILGDRMGEVIPGEPELENRPRYRLEGRSSPEDCWPDVLQAFKQGGKVLWVCNTVSDAVKVFQRGVERQIPTLIYHSRFRYRDRVERQRQVLAAFAPTAPPCLVVTTQVCEMSLDISADLLVTAFPPLPALVQRLGRLNRFADVGGPVRLCLIYPFSGRPYDKPEHRQQFDAARKAITALGYQPCSQADLAAHLDAMWAEETWIETSAWLDGGWQSMQLPAREGEDTVTMIREEDLPEIAYELGPEQAGRWTAQRLVPWTIPMPLNEAYVPARRAGGYPVAPRGSIIYSLIEGARWRKKNER